MIVLHRMPYWPSSTARTRVSEFMPPFAALYAESPGTPNTEAPEEMLTMDPPPASIMCGTAYFDIQNALVSEPVTIASQASVFLSRIGFDATFPTAVGAALLMSVVIGPYESTPATTASCTLF